MFKVHYVNGDNQDSDYMNGCGLFSLFTQSRGLVSVSVVVLCQENSFVILECNIFNIHQANKQCSIYLFNFKSFNYNVLE